MAAQFTRANACMNPYLISDENAVVSFSGGRTSGYMLWHVLEAWGKLPDWIKVIFCNTGKEMPETLDFVEECSQRWSVPILWLEFRATDPGFEIVTHTTASRKGEPFEALIKTPVNRRDRTVGVRPLPNPASRGCTTNLKTRLKKRFVNRVWGWKTYHMAIGFRSDEAHRATRGFKFAEPGEILHYPMVEARADKSDVLAFWERQPFKLNLPVDSNGDVPQGNCDLCFMKSARKVSELVMRSPALAEWWVRMEEEQAQTDRVTTFRQDRPTYREMLEAAKAGTITSFGLFDDLTSCGSHGCTD